ncbi:rCG43632 [Rattus norvegicus]|uniref:RCG43632 n=1 Tax=Rattus norvegicus TaxID=10116 RepID=A6JJA2_RAT|nr:rCG43632 [Rattus norvegicus]
MAITNAKKNLKNNTVNIFKCKINNKYKYNL